MLRNFKAGSYTGTGAAINIELGFLPDFILIVNDTDRDEMWLWIRGMAAGTAVAISTAVATLASNGVTEYVGSAATYSKGFTAGTTLSESAKVLRYVAFGAD